MREVETQDKFNIESGLVVVKFGAAWCGPCKKLEPQLEKMEKEFTNIEFISVDIDNISSLAKQYQVRSLPTLILFKNGKEIKRVPGLPLLDSLRKTLRDFSANYGTATQSQSFSKELNVANF